MQKRYTLKADGDNRVTLTLIVDNKPKEINYWAPTNGGYVRDVSDPNRPGTLGHQVCEELTYSGSTLYWDGKHPLVDMVRRLARRKGAIDWMIECYREY